jgi:ubiquinone biosynthesis protein
LPESVSPGRLATVIAQSLVAHPIFTTQAAPIFHADPHAGNFLLMPGDRLGILDWSLIGRLPGRERVALVQLLLGALALDIGRMERAIEELSEKKPRLIALGEVLRSSLRELSWGAFPGISWLTGLLDKLVLRAGMRFHANLLLFRKTLLTLEGVLADLGGADETAPQAVFDGVVGSHFLGHLTAEWPGRFLAPFNAKSPATHLSNADLVSLAWSGPAAFVRRWSEVGLCFLAAAK